MSRVVALTGATGFVGSALLNSLSSQGWHIKALSRRTANPELPHIEWIKGDLHDAAALRRLTQNTSAVIHCAGSVRGNSSLAFSRNNTQGTLNLAQAAMDNEQIPRFLLISSLAARHPEYSWYARSKYEAEKGLTELAQALPCTIFRPTALYGPGDREIKPMLNAMRHGLLTTPGKLQQRISLLHIDDLLSAVILWLGLPAPLVDTFELDDGHAGAYSWEELIKIAEQVWQRRIYRLAVPIPVLKAFASINLALSQFLPYSPMLTPGKINEITHPDWGCDNTKLTQALGWTPQVKLVQAMREACMNTNR